MLTEITRKYTTEISTLLKKIAIFQKEITSEQ